METQRSIFSLDIYNEILSFCVVVVHPMPYPSSDELTLVKKNYRTSQPADVLRAKNSQRLSGSLGSSFLALLEKIDIDPNPKLTCTPK
jgi:hypothetical protein